MKQEIGSSRQLVTKELVTVVKYIYILLKIKFRKPTMLLRTEESYIGSRSKECVWSHQIKVNPM